MSDAYRDGVALLAARPLTRREVADRLIRKGHDHGAVEDAVQRLVGSSAIDDDALARHWIATQAARGRGRDRAVASLIARGVQESVAEAAWSAAVADETLDEPQVLARAVRRRLGAVPRAVPMPKLARVYNALLSEGFASGELTAALAPYGFRRDDP
jgi:SOS response regulatory protein OraA/RecX